MTNGKPITRAWLIRQLAGCSSLSPYAFTYVSLLERVTGRVYVWAHNRWYETRRRGLKRIT